MLGGVGTTGEFTAIGDAVNLASRLETIAPVGGVLISHDTYRHVRGIFDVLARDPIVVKGKTEPVQTYVVLRAKQRAFRMATRGVEGVETRMVGRDQELAALCDAFIEALGSSTTGAVAVVGEAGVGKSRLLHEFNNWLELRPEQILYFKGRSTQNLQNLPYGLFRDLFAFRFGILESDSAAVALDKFRRGMDGVLEPERADVVGHWLGFDFGASDAVQSLLGSGDFGAIARAHLTRYFRTLAEGPVVILLEDIHWADDDSLDLVDYLVTAVPEGRLLLIAVTRLSLFERRPGWGTGEAAFRRVNLKPLSEQASRALVDEILKRVDHVPETLRTLIIDAAEGNPFYVEEMVKMLLEQGVIVRPAAEADPSLVPGDGEPAGERWTVRAERLDSLRVPPTLTGLLQARLDGLPRVEREALQRAAVVGRLFWDDAVADLAQTPVEELRPTLSTACARELIFRRDVSSFAQATEFIFKHALLRDVAYETVLLKYRADFHGRVARWLEAHAGERRDEYLSLIAEHYIQAKEGLKAAALLERSGYEAMAVGSWGPARKALERALALRSEAGETEGGYYRALIAQGEASRRLGDYPAATAALERGIAGARAAGDCATEAEGMANLAYLLTDHGQFERARELAEAAVRLAREVDSPSLAYVLYVLATIVWSTGDPDIAEVLAEEALVRAQQAGDAATECKALNTLGIIANVRRDLRRADEYYASALKRARATGNLSIEMPLLLNLGTAAYLRDDYSAARSYMETAFERAGDLGERATLPLLLVNLAQTDLKLGDMATARREVGEALALARALDMQTLVLWSVFVAGQVLAAEGRASRALSVCGLVRAHPAADHQLLLEIDEEIARMDLPPAEAEAGLAAGAALDLETVTREILAGEW
jgi:tetratricopeptide (TPR) repeat protein